MAVLLLCSAFFSASEAAMFSLRRAQRRELSKGSRAQQIIARLLDDPDRLLTAVLFWNLIINLSFFTIGSIISLADAAGRPGDGGRGFRRGLAGDDHPFRRNAAEKPGRPAIAAAGRVAGDSPGRDGPHRRSALAGLPPGHAALPPPAVAELRSPSPICTFATWNAP